MPYPQRIAKMLITLATVICAGAATLSQSGQLGKPFTPRPEWRPTHTVKGGKYIGDQACSRCHDQGEKQPSTPMGRALEKGSDCQILIAHPLLTFTSGPWKYEIARRGNQVSYTVTDGKQTISVPLLYAVGQGKAGQTYVLERNGKYYESRVSYFNAVGGLDYTLGAPREPAANIDEAFGRLLDSIETRDCIACHSSTSVVEGKLNLETMIPGINCEGCHGPGGEHVELMKAPKKSGDKGIMNPGHFDNEGMTQYCGSCHRTWAQVQQMPHARGMVNVRFQPYRIFSSKCYDFDDRRIGCTSCHDPHDSGRKAASFYDSKCQACHSSGGEKKLPLCRAGKTSGCVSCHMPEYEIPGSHHKFTDHRIRVVKPGEAYPN